MRPHVVPIADASARFIDHLREHLACVPVDDLAPLITSGAVTIAGAKGTFERPVAGGEVIAFDETAARDLRATGRWSAPFARDVTVVFEDADLLVVDKPSGMHVHPLGRYRDETLMNALIHRAGAREGNPWTEWRPHPAHRLDRPASGLVVVAKSAAIRDSFRRLLDGGHVQRLYEARVTGDVRGESGTIDAPLARDPADDYRRAVVPVERGGQPAVTHWRVVERTPGETRLALTLETGRTHQIRAHLASIGHPIVGDTLYAGGPKSPNAPEIALRAVRISFPHPRRGGTIDLSAPTR